MCLSENISILISAYGSTARRGISWVGCDRRERSIRTFPPAARSGASASSELEIRG